MKELTRSQKDFKHCQEMSKCVSCQYADQEAIKEYRACCCYAFKLEFNSNSICVTHKKGLTLKEMS